MRIGSVFLLSLLAACASAPKGEGAAFPQRSELPPPKAEQGDTGGPSALATSHFGCPALDRDVPEEMCEGLPADYGQSTAHPVEWGARAATGRSLYFGRLLCEDGSQPAILQRGSLVERAGPSSSPMSPDAPHIHDEPADIVDLWVLQCEERQVFLYSNIYRCGSPCAPTGFKLVPAEAAIAYRRGLELFQDERIEESLDAIRSALASYPDSLPIHEVLISILLQQGQVLEGLERAQTALERFPKKWHVHVLKAGALYHMDRFEEAEAVLQNVVALAPDSDRAAAGAYCLLGVLKLRRDAVEEGKADRRKACELGADSCCRGIKGYE